MKEKKNDRRKKRLKKKVLSLHEEDYPCVSSIVQSITQTPENVSSHWPRGREDEIVENPKCSRGYIMESRGELLA